MTYIHNFENKWASFFVVTKHGDGVEFDTINDEGLGMSLVDTKGTYAFVNHEYKGLFEDSLQASKIQLIANMYLFAKPLYTLSPYFKVRVLFATNNNIALYDEDKNIEYFDSIDNWHFILKEPICNKPSVLES